MRERYGGGRLALGGGVFMNVKANMLHRPRRTGSRSSSPSRPAGTSRTRWARRTSATCRSARARGVPRRPQPFGPAYLGPSVTDEEAEAVIRERRLEGRYAGRLPRAHRGAHRRAAGLGRRGGPLRGADGVRRARPRQPVHPGQPVRPSRGPADQPDDQEPRLLDAVRADHPRRAGARTTWSIRRASPRPT